ncbi:hypothetical protein ACQP00_50695 [Dactylosporangium sp. CS-047395]|uniref:hypothetical protein n=1 Tax=Dactylosporangium sp. CS-047395 TaxID=3239936 RepID=UPI003D8ADAAA
MIDDELTSTVHRAAGAVPPSAPDMQAILRRHRRRRTRQMAAAGITVLALFTTASIVLSKLTPSTEPTPATTSMATAPAADEPLIAVHRHADSVFQDKAGHELGFRLPDGLVTLHGTRIDTVPRPPEVDEVRQWLPRPDGGYALLGTKNLAPGTQREDGVNVTGLEIRLVTMSADGHLTQSRNVRIQGQDVQLAGSGPGAGIGVGYVYLARTNGGLVRHDLATGAETRLTALDAATADPHRTYSIQHNVLVSASTEECAVQAYDLEGHVLWTLRKQQQSECAQADEAAVAPDGRRLAFPVVTYDGGRATTEVLTVDLPSGAVRTAEVSQVDPPGDITYGAGILGLTWSADRLVVAWPVLPNPLTGVVDLAAVVRVKQL